MITYTYKGGPLDGRTFSVPKIPKEWLEAPSIPCTVHDRARAGGLLTGFGRYKFTQAGDGSVSANHVASSDDRSIPVEPPEPEETEEAEGNG